MAPALRARRIFFSSPSGPRAINGHRAEPRVIEHLTFMEYLEISVSTAGNRAIVAVRHTRDSIVRSFIYRNI